MKTSVSKLTGNLNNRIWLKLGRTIFRGHCAVTLNATNVAIDCDFWPRSADPGAVEVQRLQRYDIRRTGPTHLQSIRVPGEVTESVPNHISGTRADVARIYSRYKYDDEKSTALDAWDAKLQTLLWA